MSHEKKRVLEAFTKQAESYSNSSVLAAEQARIGFMIFVDPLSARCTGLAVHLEGEHVSFTHAFAWIVGSKA